MKRGTWGLIAAAALLSLASLKLLPAPFIWAGLAWTACLALGVVMERGTAVRLLLLCAATAALTLTGAEAWFWLFWTPRPEEVLSRKGFYPSDSILGWRTLPGATRATKRRGTQIIYDVTYDIDSAGWRVMPPDTARTAPGCVVLFVDSFVFGQGLQDSQTLPWLLRLRTMGRYRVFSLSEPGYGPEQMLVSLERGVVAGLPCRPTDVIYEALLDHTLRVSGELWFARRGPHYDLAADGTLNYLGETWARPPVPVQGPAARRVTEQLAKSRLYTVLSGRALLPTASDFKLYFAIVARVSAVLQAEYPGVAFHVLVWQPITSRYARYAATFLAGLRRTTPHVHVVNDLLPGFAANPLAYRNDRTDPHPNARADAVLVDWIARCILHVEGAGPTQPPTCTN